MSRHYQGQGRTFISAWRTAKSYREQLAISSPPPSGEWLVLILPNACKVLLNNCPERKKKKNLHREQLNEFWNYSSVVKPPAGKLPSQMSESWNTFFVVVWRCSGGAIVHLRFPAIGNWMLCFVNVRAGVVCMFHATWLARMRAVV